MQASFSDLEYAAKKKVARRDRFLGEINAITPWSALVVEIAPFYPKGGGRRRPPSGLERMLRMYVAQQCFGFSDEGIEDALYDSQAIRGFVGIDLNREAAPDATTLLKFRHLLEQHQLTERIFAAINAHLTQKGLMLKEGTIVDATIIATPAIRVSRSGQRAGARPFNGTWRCARANARCCRQRRWAAFKSRSRSSRQACAPKSSIRFISSRTSSA
jgi:IS5 family transposase